MSDPLTYSNDVSNYAKSSPASDAIQYVLGKSPDSNLAPGTTSYSQFYNQGLDPSVYASEFILGHSKAAVNPYILPGDRYNLPILDKKYDSKGNMISSTNKRCFDASGKAHDLSSIIDNVDKTAVLRDSSNQGLFYSLYASLSDYDKGISNIDLSKNSYLCKPITTYMDDSGKKKTTPAYVLTSDTEGFAGIDPAAYQDISAVIVTSPGSSPGSIPKASNVVNPAILTPSGLPQTDKLGLPMYVNDGKGGGPTQQSLNSPIVATNAAIMEQYFPSTPGQSMAQTGLANIQSLIAAAAVPSPVVSSFTTIESSDIVLHQYQNRKKNPWKDPIFLFYVGSLGLLFGSLIYRLIHSKNR
jgi:hypothetical protein